MREQPRRYFDEAAMEELMASIKQHGILQPLLVRPVGEGYELVAGERRYRAAKAAGLLEVPVIIGRLSDSEALQLSLLENLQREDLNPLEETEGILQLLELELKISRDAIIELLGKAAHPEREAVDKVIHSEQWQRLVAVFATLGRFTPESFRTNRLPLLKLPEDMKPALGEGKLAYTKARAIAQVKDDDARGELFQAAIAENLSLTQIKECIAQARAHQQSPAPSLNSQIDLAYAKVKKSSVWDDVTKREKLQKLLKELQELIE